MDGDFRRFTIANFSDHDDVGILPRMDRSPAANVRLIFGFTCIWPMPSS